MKKLLLCLALAAPVLAHAGDLTWNYSLTPVYVTDSDLDAGGQVSSTWLMGSLGATFALDQNQRVGLNFSASQQNWHFDSPKAWGGNAPWQDLNRYQLSMPYSYATAGGWIYSLSPGVEYSAEEGADRGESINYGVTTFVAKQFSPTLMLGVGLNAWQGAKDDDIIPFIVVNWKINDTLTLKNPYVAGPVGPAGLELAWQVAPKWELSAGGAIRNYEARLAKNNAQAANGAVEINTLPVFVSANYALTQDTSLKMYAGAALNGEFVISDQYGNEVSKENAATMPFFGVTVSGKF